MIPRREFLRSALAAAAAARLAAQASSPAATRNCLYLAGHLDSQDPVALRRTVDNLGPSGFNVVILAFLHVRFSAGRVRLVYNRDAAGAWSPALPGELARLRTGFATRRRVMLSIGGWGNRADFEAIRTAGVETFLDALDRDVIAPLGLDGIDLDLEPSTVAENTPTGWRAVHDDLGATLVGLTRGYKRRHPAGVVTHAPIASVAAELYVRDAHLRGVPGGLLAACGPALDWINVQLYEAGDLATGMVKYPGGIATFWREQLHGPDPRFVPGFEPHRQPLPTCEAALAGLRRAGMAPPGYFLWEYGQIATQLGAWQSGLANAAFAQGN